MTIQELERCIQLYSKDIYSFCMHLTKEKGSADDLYQDTFLEATKKLAVIRYEDNPKSYLLSVAIRLWKNRVRKFAWRNRIAPQVGETALEQEGGATPDVSEKAVADEITDGGALAKAFESKDAVLVNETQKTAGYDITLMGLVSGKDLMPVAPEDSLDSISKEKTYAVLAIAKEDGSPMPGMQDNDYQIFCASALVKGKSFMDVNNGTLNAGAYAFEQDGVQYQILECDNLEIFANIGVYVGVVEDFGEESHAFTMYKETGEYRVDESYDGMKALFTIPLDKSKADDAAAEKFFQEIEAEDAQEFLKQHAEVYFRETYTLNENEGLCVQTNAGEAEYDKDTLPKEAGVETVSAFSSDGTLAGTFGDSITKNEDGTYTYTVYRPINLK